MEENNNGDTITVKKETLWKYSTVVLLALVVVMAFVAFSGDDEGTNVGAQPSAVNPSVAQPLAAPTPARSTVTADDDPVLGNPDAPVTIIEFSDFQCPFCKKLWSETLPLIKAQYIDTGKAKLVYRDFPLGIHPMAMPAALAAECVHEQGGDEAYFEYHDMIFTNQQTLSDANLKAWALELGYDIDECLDSEKYKDEVNKDLRDGQAAGVTGTPGTFINGKLIKGAQGFSVFQQAIEAELA